MNDKKLDQVIERAKAMPWAEAKFYAAWMAQVHYFTRHSVQMLLMAASETENEEFKREMVKHVKLETGHDKMALKDLERLGFELAQLPEFGVTRSMWEAQLYKCRKCPQSLLGYIYALEKAAVVLYGAIQPKIREAYGADKITFVKLHAEEDIEHVEIQAKQIAALPAFEKNEALINIEQTAQMLGHLFEEVLAFSKKP